ncbi:MAG: efflux transporter outer membrane subunit [Mucilaginibacter sp.]
MKVAYPKYIFSALLVSNILFSCKITKTYKRPDLNTNNLYRDVNTGDTTGLANIPWRSLFADTVLQGLIQEGLDQNLNLKIAIQRINEAQAALRQSKAAFYPSLSGNASVAQSRQSAAALNFPAGTVNLNSTSYQAYLSTSWEADVWGKLSSTKRAALANFLQSDAAKRAVQTQLIADIANNYYNLLALDKQLEITQQTVKSRVTEVETMKALKEGAVVTGAAVVQSEANRYAAEVSVPDIRQNIRETENALCVLLARAPGPIKRTTLALQQAHTELATGVPTLLLNNRPDVQQAEFALRGSFENTNIARAYFYPSFTITAQGGLSSLNLSSFFNGSVFFNLIGGLTQPIFSQGQNKARLKTAQAQQQEALYNFQQSLLTAGQEVSNTLFSYQTAVEKEQTRLKQLQALEKAVDYTKELMRYSSATNYTDVLTSEQSLLAAQLSSVNDSLQKLQAIVNLYRALGGGWK